jgi:hypothetical protein
MTSNPRFREMIASAKNDNHDAVMIPSCKPTSKQANKPTSKHAEPCQFNPPSIEEVKAYQQEKAQSVDANTFLEYYSLLNWIDKNGNQVKNWKLKMLTWHNKRVDEGWKPQPPPKPQIELPPGFEAANYGEGGANVTRE